jgi:hypothetical protein
MTIKALSIALQEQRDGEVTNTDHGPFVVTLVYCPDCLHPVMSEAELDELIEAATDFADFKRRYIEVIGQHAKVMRRRGCKLKVRNLVF